MEAKKSALRIINHELQEGMNQTKCKKCGCMRDAIENLRLSLPSTQTEASADLLAKVENWIKQLEQTKYSCLGCEHCFPAVVTNVFNEAFPDTAKMPSSSCSFEVKENMWPPVPGEYFLVCEDPYCSVAVSTLASGELAETLSRMKPSGLCIVGKTETENIGIDKIIKNTITNPNIRFLIIAGKESEGHQSGKTLSTLWENGIDENMHVKKSPATHPVLKNVTSQEVETFRKQVSLVKMIGCEDPVKIANRIKRLTVKTPKACSCKECSPQNKPVHISTRPVIIAKKKVKVEVDKAGYFVIIPQPPKKVVVEHYSYENKLLRVVEGENAEDLYSIIIGNGWVSQLSHAAYLGKELAKAELSLKLGFKYTQDLNEKSVHKEVFSNGTV